MSQTCRSDEEDHRDSSGRWWGVGRAHVPHHLPQVRTVRDPDHRLRPHQELHDVNPPLTACIPLVTKTLNTVEIIHQSTERTGLCDY